MKRVSLEERLNKKKPIDTVFESTENETIKPTLKKMTVYIPPEQYVSLEEIQLAELKRTGHKPDKSELFKEAIELLVRKYQS